MTIKVPSSAFSADTERLRCFEQEAQAAGALNHLVNRKITANSIKWILDGTPFARAAAMRQPYADAPNERGKLHFTEAEIAKMLQEPIAFRQPILFHAAGDRTMKAILSAMENIKDVDWRIKCVRIEFLFVFVEFLPTFTQL